MKNRTEFYFYLGFGILLIPYIIWFILGENSYVLIHDNLDSEFVFIQHLLKSGDLFGFNLNSEITPVMNGIDRTFFRSGINFTFLIFSIFPPIIAYIFHHMLVHLIGYAGMFLLIKRYLIKQNDFVVMLISLCFGFLSYYHIQYGISISGQPILLFAFLNLLNGNRNLYNWLIIGVFPFFSFLPVTLPFFLPLLVLVGLINFYQTRVFPKSFLLGIVVICSLNMLVEYNLIYTTLFGDNISHRTDWKRLLITGQPTLNSFISVVKDGFRTHYHTGILSGYPVLYSLFIGILFRIKISKEIIILLILLLLILIWSALNTTILYYLGDYFEILKVFQFDRFYFMAPFLWLLLLATILKEYNYKIPMQKYAAIIFVFLMARDIVKENVEMNKNFKIISSVSIDESTFAQFYDEEIFNEISAYVGMNNIKKYNFISIGFYPNIAQYNGFRTLDSYQNNYSLSYKNEFRKIIKGELEKDSTLQKYFDYWGSRCYAFSSELGNKYTYRKYAQAQIMHLDFDLDQVKKMEGKYILSAVPIEDSSIVGLNYLRSFTTEESYWMLFLYEII
jgi:hypothetical protein